MKQLLLVLMLFVGIATQAQVVTVTAVDNFGGIKSVVGAGSSLLTPLDSAGAAATKLATKGFVTTYVGAQGYITGNQAITFTASGDVTGTSTGSTSLSPTLTLKNTGTAGTFAYPSSVTTDAQGRVTSVTAGSAPSVLAGESGFSATAGQTAFAVTNMPATASNVIVTRNGIKLIPATDFTVAAGALTATNTRFTIATGDAIQVQWFK